MAGLDAATASAVAALVVAIIALFVAIAQATQQYLITGQLIRLCDSVVFGPMPGQGRRVWQFSQFRFRVIYSIPQISLDTNLWPSGGAHMKSHAIGELELPPLADVDIQDDASSGSLVLPTASRVEVILDKTGWRTALSWFRRRGEQQFGSDDSDDLSGRESSIIPEKHRFRLPISFPAGLRRRRPSPPPSSASGSYPASVLDGNNARLYGQPFRRRNNVRRLLGSADSQRSVSRPMPSQAGEASWLSFCRAIEIPCKHSVRIDLVEYDADRCPSDLITVPMQVSMRDVVVMALMAGMELTSASFSNKSISMQGAVGTLTSSNHAILGPILHFTPRNVENSLPMIFGERRQDVYGKISSFWVARTWNTCSVAGTFYNSTGRRTTRRLDDRWIRDKKGVESYGVEAYVDPKKPTKKKKAKRKKEEESADKSEPAKGKARSTQVAVRPRIDRDRTAERRPEDGDWIIYHPPGSFPAPLIGIPMPLRRPGNAVFVRPNQGPIPFPPTNIPMAGTAAEAEKDTQGPSMQAIPVVVRSEDEKNSREPPKPDDTQDHEYVPGPPPSFPPMPPMGYPMPLRRATVEDDPDEEAVAARGGSSRDIGITPLIVSVGDGHSGGQHETPNPPSSERARLAKERQDARAERLKQIKQDKMAVKKVMERGAMGYTIRRSPGDGG
ncbi:hypothetical protein O1611_g3697 [Lasiodiplodia mahajangana]|uniref:Uncharacterized protein n=1 Tax=Lasiodiplodia mahajangana TaxID=1108764 RepID=A0ACC2JR09_9PEZI|nr:hypothetical protein O1611_g3697 [Lasiodiplodia mahajangana]